MLPTDLRTPQWAMSQDTTVQLQPLLDRLRQGDKAARREFLELVCAGCAGWRREILSGSFPNLQARHDVDSVVHETWLRLMQALDKADPPTVADFFRLAAHKIRQVLLDMADRQRRIDQRETFLSRGDSQSAAESQRTRRTRPTTARSSRSGPSFTTGRPARRTGADGVRDALLSGLAAGRDRDACSSCIRGR